MARSFDGSSGRILYTAASAQKSLTQVTWHFRAYRSGPGEVNYGVVFAQEDNAGNRKYRVENDNGDAGWGIVFIARWSDGTGVWSIAYPTNNIWYDYIVTYDGSSTSNDAVWYKDGVSQSVTERSAPSGTLATTDDLIAIGNNKDDSQTWNGRICEVSLWNRILTSTEITAIGVNNYSPAFYPDGLVFYDKLNPTLNPSYDEAGKITGEITSTSSVASPDSIKYPGEPIIMNNLRPRPFAPGIAR